MTSILPLQFLHDTQTQLKRSRLAFWALLLLIVCSSGLIIYYLVKSNSLSLLNQQELREGIVGQPRFLNPLFSPDNDVDRTIIRLLFNSLVIYSQEEKKFIGDLAERYEISDDGKEYHFFLKNDKYFHDGQKVTMDDVLFTYQVIQSDNYHGFWKDAFANVTISKVNDTELKMILKDPVSSFIQHNVVGILPKHEFKDINDALRPSHLFNVSPIGSNVYAYSKKEFYTGSTSKIESLLLRNTNNLSAVPKIRFIFFDSEESLLSAFKMGKIDSFGTLNSSVKDTLHDWHNYILNTLPLQKRYYALFFNLKSDKKINLSEMRQALHYALDEEKLVKEVFPDENIELMYGPLEQDSWAFNPEVEKYPYNLEKAKTLIENIPEEERHFALTFPQTDVNEHVSEFLQKEWKEIGVVLDLQPVQIYELRDKVVGPRNYEILLMGQEVSEDPDRYSIWHSTKTDYPSLNISQIQDRFIDRALENGRKKISPKDRISAYKDFQRYFQIELPSITLYQPNYYYFVSKRWNPRLRVTYLNIPEDRFNGLLTN